MSIRFPLHIKILLWLCLNLVFLGAVFYGFFKIQFRFGIDSVLLGAAGERIQAVSDLVASELGQTPQARWDEVLQRFGRAYQIQFSLFGNDGQQAAGASIKLPAEVLAKITERRGRGWGSAATASPRGGRGPPPGRGMGRMAESMPLGPPLGRGPNRGLGLPGGGPYAKFMEHSSNPSRYWIGVCLPALEIERTGSLPLTLLAMSESLNMGGLIFDLGPWVGMSFGALLLSVLFWIPLVRGITRSISQMTRATEQIAQGRFDASVETRRRDELGRLARAINQMAARLAGFVAGQKRFLGDTAHELCSPLSRIQIAIGILEQRTDEKQKAYVDDLREDVQHISSLVNELLSFSKAGLRQTEIKLERVNLAALAQRVVAREAIPADQIQIQIGEGVQAMAEPELLSRALANLIRNAVRYAGQAGPITLSAIPQASQVILTVTDQGPGVPEEALGQIFDPFFRLEPSRSRETGGIGLGLAIVKTCVEACQGTVSARNCSPSGLQVEVVLRAGAEGSNPP